MNTKVLFILTALISTSVLAKVDRSNPLPNWIDHSREKKVVTEYPFEKGLKVAPPASFRLPAEYEPTEAVVMGWMAYTPMLNDIAKIVSQEGNAKVWVANGPNSLNNVPYEKHEKFDCRLNTVWMRDYGPVGILENKQQLAVVDSVYRHYAYRVYDDSLPSCIAESKGMESFDMDLILDGGNLMVDSAGNLFMTNRTYLWNKNKSKEEVDQILKDYFNVKNIHSIDYAGYPYGPADGTGHIDMFVKLLDDSTVLIAETEAKAFKETCDKAAKYFRSIKAPNGKDYKIVRVKAWVNGRSWYTYTNSLIVNGKVIMPSYSGHEQDDIDAIAAYKAGNPNLEVFKVNSDRSIRAGGSIHCVTQAIPKAKK